MVRGSNGGVFGLAGIYYVVDQNQYPGLDSTYYQIHDPASYQQPRAKKPFVCPICKHSFTMKKNLRRHVMYDHGSPKFQLVEVFEMLGVGVMLDGVVTLVLMTVVIIFLCSYVMRIF